MKQLLLVLLICFFNNVMCQHLKIQGVEIDGKHSSFYNNIRSKGWIYDGTYGGNVAFKGRYYGTDAYMFVYHNSQYDFIYEAKIVIERDNISSAIYLAKEITNSLSQKYGHKATHYYNADYYESVLNLPYGWISVFVQEKSRKDGFAIFVDYEDRTNTNRHKQLLQNDL